MSVSADLVEIELRGRLDPSTLRRIHEEAKSWQYEGRFNRYLMNFTNGELRARKLDLRGRITNGAPELVLKHGEWGSGERVETIVHCERGQIENVVKFIVGLGYFEAIGGHRIIDRYLDGAIEFSLVEVPGHSYFYEAELLVPAERQDEARETLQLWCRSHNLPVFTKEEYLSYIDELDRDANDSLDFRTEASRNTLLERVSSIQ